MASVRPLSPMTKAVPPGRCDWRKRAVAIAEVKMRSAGMSIGLDIPAERIFTSAMATARFLQSQRPGGTAFVIGESGLTEAIHSVGYVLTDRNPDYVVLGETFSYNLELVTKALRLVVGGVRFIATNPDPVGPAEGGLVPACGAMAALI